MSTWLAWLAPWLLGSGLWMLASGRPRYFAQWCSIVGGGWLLGMLLVTWTLNALSGWISPQESVSHLGPGLALFGILAWFFGWRAHSQVQPKLNTLDQSARRWWWLGALLLGLLLVRFWFLFDTAILRPLFPWDAWWVWSVKPKVWYLLDMWVPFVGNVEWTTATDMVFTSGAPGYPGLLANIQVWFASGAGCWCDPAFTALWPMLWAAMLVLGYGQLRSLNVGVVPALVAVYALGSLPLINAHAALAGYADLWIAVVFASSLLCWMHWQQRRDWRQLLLALALALSLPTIKLEGAVWLMLWFGVLVLGLIPRHWRGWSVLAAVACVVFGLALGGFSVPIPGLGWVEVSATSISVPGKHAFALGWHPVLPALLNVLFVQPNWHLLFYIAPLMIAWRWRNMLRTPGLDLMALGLFGGALFLFVLFFWTDAAAWARNYTSVNRLLLHIVPALVFFLAMIFDGRAFTRSAPDTVPTSRPPPRPA